MSARRPPAVSPWAERFVDPAPYEEPAPEDAPAGRSWLADRLRAQQAEYREKAVTYKRACSSNFGTGCALVALYWLPYHIGTVCWFVGIAFAALAGLQWIKWMVNRRAARMYPDPEDLVLR